MEYNKKNILCFSPVCLEYEGNEICNFATTSFSLLLSVYIYIIIDLSKYHFWLYLVRIEK